MRLLLTPICYSRCAFVNGVSVAHTSEALGSLCCAAKGTRTPSHSVRMVTVRGEQSIALAGGAGWLHQPALGEQHSPLDRNDRFGVL